MKTQIQAAIEALIKIANILEGYAESYEAMARQNPADPRVRMGDVAVDIRQNMKSYVSEQIAALQAAPAQGSIDTPEFQRLAHDYRRHQTDADYTALVAHIDAHIAQRDADADWLIKTQRAALDSLYATNAELSQRAASADGPVYQIANDSKPSGWSDVTKEGFDLHLVTTWRKKRILYAAPVAAEPALVGPLYTCIGKGGDYEIIGHALGAGDLKGTSATVYRDVATGQIYVRDVADFHKRMEPK